MFSNKSSRSFENTLPPVVDHESVPVVGWNRLSKLLHSPLRCGMRGGITIQNPPEPMFQDDEYIMDPERYCDDNKEVTCQNFASIIAQESDPALVITWSA